MSDTPVTGPSNPPRLGDKLADLGRWAESLPTDLPPDLAANHDHYLHGLPKRRMSGVKQGLQANRAPVRHFL